MSCSVSENSTHDHPKISMKNIFKIGLDGKEYSVELNDSKTANEFAQLPSFDTSLSRSGGSHYWGPIPRKLSTTKEMKTSNPQKGGVYYADHLTAFAVYFDDAGSIAPYVIYHVGDIEGDMSGLSNAGYRIKLKVD